MSDIKEKNNIVLGGGCFWCQEVLYSHVKGVLNVISGYAGGNLENPTYEQVSSGKTGHAEVVNIEFDPEIISLEDILHIFFTVHDPTTLNQQGNDRGTQYRSVILYSDEEQRAVSEKIAWEISEEKVWEDPIVTEVAQLEKFYPAEEYHQKYFEKNPEQAYCQIVIVPKVAKFRQKWGHLCK